MKSCILISKLVSFIIQYCMQCGGRERRDGSEQKEFKSGFRCFRLNLKEFLNNVILYSIGHDIAVKAVPLISTGHIFLFAR